MPSFVTDDPTCFFTFSSLRLGDTNVWNSLPKFSANLTREYHTNVYVLFMVWHHHARLFKHFTKTKFCRLKSAILLDYNNCRTHSVQTLKFQLSATFVTATLATPIHNKPTRLHSVRLLLHATSPGTVCSHLIQALAKVWSGQPHCAYSPELSTHWHGKS